MGKLIYAAITSLDGYVEDERGGFQWSAPDEEVHSFVNDLERSTGTYLFGRRMYETMTFWETVGPDDDAPPVFLDYAAIWKTADKVVFSRTLREAPTARTRIEHDFDRAAVQHLKQTTSADIGIGGAELAGQALRAGLVDELHLFLCPIVVGGGKPALPADVALQLELREQHHFGGGVVHLHYRVVPDDFCYVTTTGRRSGRAHRIEIWYARVGDTVYLLSGGAGSSDWVRNLVAEPAVQVELAGRTHAATARVVTDRDEAARARALVFAKYQPRSGDDLADWRDRALPIALDLGIGPSA